MSGMKEAALTYRIVLADDHALVREGIRGMLDGEPDLAVVGEANNGREAIEACRLLRPDLVLMDVRMPEMDGLRATRTIKQEFPLISVMMVTMHEDPDYLFEAVSEGAVGYVLKGSNRQQLVEAIRRVLSGESSLDPDLAMRFLKRLAAQEKERPISQLARDSVHPPHEPLTVREVEVVRLVAEGQTNPIIARDLFISVGTVKAHVQHIIAKLGVSDRTQAAVRAAELGLLSVESEE